MPTNDEFAGAVARIDELLDVVSELANGHF